VWLMYTKPRRPIWVGPRLGLQDMQGVVPRFWCPNCGTEVFLRGVEKCRRCEKEDRENEKLSKSLLGMHTGSKPERMRE